MFDDDLFYVVHNKLITDIRNTIEDIEDMRTATDKKLEYLKKMLAQLSEHVRQRREDERHKQRGTQEAM